MEGIGGGGGWFSWFILDWNGEGTGISDTYTTLVSLDPPSIGR